MISTGFWTPGLRSEFKALPIAKEIDPNLAVSVNWGSFFGGCPYD